jgi:hypothetical protein
MKRRNIEVLEVTPIKKIELISETLGNVKLPKLRYGDVVTVKIDGVAGFWLRTKSRREWACMITGKAIKPREYCYRPLNTGVTLWYPDNRISEVVIKALLDIEPADNRAKWRGATTRDLIDGVFKDLSKSLPKDD